MRRFLSGRGFAYLLAVAVAAAVSGCQRTAKVSESKGGTSGTARSAADRSGSSVDTTQASGSAQADATVPGMVPVYTYRVIHEYPHDPRAFTQGLVYADGVLYEGTGLRGRSSLRKVDLETGEVLKIHTLPDSLFGEGIAVFGNTIVQLTWQSRIGFVYDRRTFALKRTFRYSTEGWGLTYDGRRLIMSDGTSTLYFRDPVTLARIGQVEVTDASGPVRELNELEYVDGKVYANVWQTNRIAQISPETGQVTGWIDLTGLLSPEDRVEPVDVLNGIAYDAKKKRLFVTGKLWPKLFEIALVREN